MSAPSATQRSSLRLREQLRLLALTPKKHRQLTSKIGREAAPVSRIHTRKMQAPDSLAWAPVKSKRKPTRIKRMAKRLKSKAAPTTPPCSLWVPMLAWCHT